MEGQIPYFKGTDLWYYRAFINESYNEKRHGGESKQGGRSQLPP